MKKTFLIFPYIFILVSLIHAIPESEVHLTFLGDIMAHDVNYRIKDFSVVYRDVKDILTSDDLTFANLESPVNEKEPYYTYPSFNMRRDYVSALANAGIDVLSLANNHSYDRGKDGIVQTICSIIILKETRNMELYYSGIRANTKIEYKPVTIRKKGWKIGFLAVSQFLNSFRKNDYVNIVNYRDEAESNRFIDYIKSVSREYDLFILSYHGDTEYSFVPDPRKVEFFDKLVNAGCHIVYSHHPHVLQPYKLIEVNGSSRLIMYSMGNFISGQRWYYAPIDVQDKFSYTGDSVMLKVKAEYKNNSPSISIEKSILITNHINEKREVVIKLLENIANEISDPGWIAYYKERLKIMTSFLSEFSQPAK
jgi:hypothetical protein